MKLQARHQGSWPARLALEDAGGSDVTGEQRDWRLGIQGDDAGDVVGEFGNLQREDSVWSQWAATKESVEIG